MKWHNNTDEEFIEAAKHSSSIAGMCKYLGRSPYGAGYYMMHKKIEELNIDVSHFTGKAWNVSGKNLVKNTKTPDELVFCEHSKFGTSKLKDRLVKGGYREEKCERCGRTEWEGDKIPLQTHHINGIHDDNRLENLMLLCPNCHAQTDNYCSKNVKKERTEHTEKKNKKTIEKTCPVCGKTFFCEREQQKYCSRECSQKASIKESKKCPICGKMFHPKDDKQKYCSQECAHKSVRKRPEKEVLEGLIKEHTNCAIAKMYGVSDRMVGRWREKYKI